jgi:transcription elongation factor Elf1
MIFLWLWIALRWCLRLIFPPPPKVQEKTIDPHARCPSCGHRSGSITAVQDERGVFVKHLCKVCGAWWLVKPVFQDSKLFSAKPTE